MQKQKDGNSSSLDSWQTGTKFELMFSRGWERESGHGAHDSHEFPWEFHLQASVSARGLDCI
jgi:hypothetical protein